MFTARLGSLTRATGSVRARLSAAIFLGLVARLSLALATRFPWDDATFFGSWATTMRDRPLGAFYASAWRADHLPGDLWVLKLLQSAYTAAGGSDFHSRTFEVVLKTVPITADLAIGILLFSLVKTWGTGEAAARAAQWYLLNPAVIALSAVWGQWDALSAAVLLTGFLIAARGGRSWVWAAPCLVWAVLIKPPLVLVEVVIVVWLVVLSRSWNHGVPRPVVSARAGLWFVVSGVATAVAALAPFRVGLAWAPAAGWSLLERVQVAADAYPATTVGAANLWMAVDGRVIGRADDVARWGPITPAAAALTLFVLAMGAVAVTAWRAFPPGRQPEALLWCAAAGVFGSCLFLTRVHERYYFPALVCLLLWASIREYDAVTRGFFWMFSVVFVVDLALPRGWGVRSMGLADQAEVLASIGLLHVAIFLALLAAPWRSEVRRQVRAGAPSGATGARRTAPG